MALIDIIKFDGLRNRDWVVYKHYTDQIVSGAQLIVQEGQTAIFVKGGNVCDVFATGTYTLNSKNLPLLNKIVNLPFGGKTPFSAEVYFVNTATKLDLTWGTTDPIQVIDPKYGVKLRVRAFGQMGLKMVNPVEFFRELVGGMRLDDIVRYDKIIDFYRGILVIKVKTGIAETIISDGISALEIVAKLESLSAKVEEKISEEFLRYGLRVVNFYIQSINFPDQDFAKINQILEDKAAFDIMGDNRYTTKRAFDVYEGAANNEGGIAGAFAAGGIGFGAGMNLGAAMGGPLGAQLQQGNVRGYRECPSCHRQNASDARFCTECGYHFEQDVCACGNRLSPGTKFCPQCGRQVGV